MRPAHAVIDLDALRHNYRLARELGGGQALAIVKADAYGHGAVQCAQALANDVDGFGVACIEEALELRDAGIGNPILLLEGFFDADELPLIERHDLQFAVSADWQLDALERYAPGRPLGVWVKMDSGMHRLGFSPEEFQRAWTRLQGKPWVQAPLVAMTHFARSDELDSSRTGQQIAMFDATCASLHVEAVSMANSAGILGWPDSRRNIVRPGLMLYGANPFPAAQPQASRLRPVMSLRSQIIAVRDLAAGEPIGYGGGFITDAPTRVGLVAMGYADGYPQYAPEGTPVSVDEQRSRIIGRVSMDMLTVDLTHLPQAALGSAVELWGNEVSIDDVARHSHNSAYRLLTGLKRAPRSYLAPLT